jgi:hypothetical protein
VHKWKSSSKLSVISIGSHITLFRTYFDLGSACAKCFQVWIEWINNVETMWTWHLSFPFLIEISLKEIELFLSLSEKTLWEKSPSLLNLSKQWRKRRKSWYDFVVKGERIEILMINFSSSMNLFAVYLALFFHDFFEAA